MYHGCSVWSGWVCPTPAITSNLHSLSGSFECGFEDRHKRAYQDFKGPAKHAKKDHEGYTLCRKDNTQQVEEHPVTSRHKIMPVAVT